MQKIDIEDGVRKISAYVNVFPGASHLLVICHGFRGGKENGGRIFDFSDHLQSVGFAVLAFDFTGSGESTGDFSEVTLSRQAEDLKLVLNYVKKNISLPIILLGRSFGGTTVLAGGTAESEVKGFVLWSTPVFLHSTFARIMPKEYKLLKSGTPVELADENGGFQLYPDIIRDFDNHNMDKYLGEIDKRPVLVIHGENDDVVSIKNAYYIISKLSNCTLKIFSGSDHKFIYNYREREDYTINWLKQNFKTVQE